MKLSENFVAYLKVISVVSINLALIFAFFDGLKSIAFTFLAVVCALSDIQINIRKGG
jgi:hypothetical protein